MTAAFLTLYLLGLPLVWRLLRLNYVPTRTALIFTAIWPFALLIALSLGAAGVFDDAREEE